ncbi:MAG TPA: hypothetical protein VFZ91_14035 [Allosphingosinicella sp.]
MADDRKPGEDGPLSAAELARLQALASKRDQALETMSNTVRKQEETRRGIIDRMR